MNFTEIFEKYWDLVIKIIDDTVTVVSSNTTEVLPGYPDPQISAFVTIARSIYPEIAFMKMGNTRPLFGAIVGYDGEYPLVKKRGTFTEERVEEVKLAIATAFNEVDYKMLRQLALHQRAQNNEFLNAIIEEILVTPAKLTEAITILATKLLIDLFYGECQYIDTLTGLGWEMSYMDAIPTSNRPLPLTGAALWSSPATAKPLENLASHLQTIYDNSRSMVEAVAFPSAVALGLLNARDTKVKIIRSRGYMGALDEELMTSIARPTIQECRDWLSNEILTFSSGGIQVPQFLVSDAVYSPYRIDTIQNNLTPLDVPFLRPDGYVFLTKGIIEGLFTPTATDEFRSPLAFFTKKENAPRRESTSIDTSFIGYCLNTKKLGWRKVI